MFEKMKPIFFSRAAGKKFGKVFNVLPQFGVRLWGDFFITRFDKWKTRINGGKETT